MMLRIAEKIARRRRAHGVVTGDSVAQVASQTLQNLEAVGSIAELPIYRPLIGDDKQDILDLAKKIGTYEISSEPFTDCCPMYLPKSPRIFSNSRELDAAEANLPVQELVRAALLHSRKEIYEYRNGEVSRAVLPEYELKVQTLSVGAG
jgi:thiamine biosynthesis protein ThiI